jgi:hypothetical protein
VFSSLIVTKQEQNLYDKAKMKIGAENINFFADYLFTKLQLLSFYPKD